MDPSETLYGTDLFGDPVLPPWRGALAARFLVPPFSVLRQTDGFWAARKAAWLACGIRSELGRGAEAFGDAAQWQRKASGLLHSGLTVDAANGDKWDGGRSAWQNCGTSIFDPVLCEIAYRWFCPPGGQVVDPFAGGSVRGVVAGMLGRPYWGCDLSAVQVAANREQAAEIGPPAAPQWVIGDSAERLAEAPAADFVFSCPPYGSLERYSDDARDLSAMGDEEFASAYGLIIAAACERLRPDRFACFVVGNYRTKAGRMVDLVGLTVRAFEAAGAEFYNEAILVNSCGSLPVRAGKQFAASRKLGKTHQNVLVFAKGSGRKAADACSEAEFGNEADG